MRIGIVAGEASGDLLGAGLIRAIKQRVPDAVIEGIAGPRMIEQGCVPLFPAEKLAVMGLVEVLAHLRELRAIRRSVIEHFLQNPPDVFVGIDAPDFNLGLEKKLKQAGIRTVHYVSPSVWAWRRYRVHKIARATDLMLTLFPFEAAFYEGHRVPVRFVGHPLADMIGIDIDRRAARRALGLPADDKIIALLPGSRLAEVRMLSRLFIDAAHLCCERLPDVRFVVPLATPATLALFKQELETSKADLPITLLDGQAHTALAAADAVLLASGTATLEALLFKCPMVVAYRLMPATYWLAKHLVKIPWVALPNLLAGKELVPEFIQDAATPERLASALLRYFEHPDAIAALSTDYLRIHHMLRKNADEQAADAVLGLASHPQ